VDDDGVVALQIWSRAETPYLSTTSMSTDYKFEGWVGLDANAAKGNMVWQSYEPKAFQETDIDVRCLEAHVQQSW
jgi:hypothetical protein